MSVQEPLVGAELIAKVKELPDASKSELVRATGYVSTKKNGGARLNFTAYYEALAAAHGAPIGKKPRAKTKELSYKTTVLTTGALVIGKRYIEDLGLAPGDQMDIKPGPGQICLVPVGGESEDVLS